MTVSVLHSYSGRLPAFGRNPTLTSNAFKVTRLPPGNSNNQLGIRIRGDTDVEPDETVVASISLEGNVPGVTLGTSTATYTILDDDDTTAPGVTSIERQSPSDEITNADSLTWRVTFSEAVRNVDTTDFSLVILNTSTAFPQTTLAVSSVSTSVYDITASGNGPVHAEGHIQLVFASGHDIEDLSGNALPASPMVSGTNDNSFQLDNTAPTVTSITRQMPTTAMTDADSLTWRVTFDDAMQHVNAADFQVSGTTATITAVSPVTGSETTAYDVTATGGNLAGLNATVTLSFANTHNIEDEAGNRLASTTPTSGTNDNTFEVSNFVADTGAPKLVSVKRHAQEVRNLGTSLVWRVSFDKYLPGVYASDFTLTGTTAGLDVRHDLSNYDPVTYKTSVLVIAQGGDLDTVSGTVTLNFASNHNIRDEEGRALPPNPTPTSGTNQNTFTLNPAETLLYFTQENYYVDEGDEAVVTLKLSRLRDTATTISAISATPLTATGNGVDYHGQTYSVTIPAWRASGTVNIRTSDDTLTEDEETFRIDIHTFNLPAGVVVGKAPGGTLNAGQTYINIRDEETATAKAKKEPGLVFDNAHLTWNEADGCGNTGPSYNVKLKTKPLGPVEVFIEDPDDNNPRDDEGDLVNTFVTNGRLYVANSYYWGDEDTKTILHFTPGNWDTYQRVNVKVRCADHYTAQIPIKHRIYAGYIDKYTPSPVYPGYFGIIDKGWTVHVNVREANPPIVVKHLPAVGETIQVDEGGHKDFEITLKNGAFEHDSSVPVYLSARGGKAAGVKRRDGSAQSCGGPLDDCLYFTPSNPTQWVRLFAINPGRDELKVEIPQLRWGNLEHVRDWEMRWPVQVIQAGQGSPAQSAAAPTQAVSNLQVTAIDDTSASVTWNAVEHARFYEVSWEAESSDKQTVISGIESVAGTSATIQHNAQEAMTLTVTVTPEYVDGNGITQRMEAFAATATLAVGPSGQRLESGGGTNGGNGGSIDSGYGAVDLPVPVSHWRFEYDAVDWVGSSHGTESGGVAFEANEEGEGVEDHALSLDGSDDYVDLSTHVSDFPLGDSTRSVTGWFKADAGNQGQTFFAYGPNVAGKRFSIAADRTQVLVAVSGHAWGVNGLEQEDGWHHIAVTYAGGDSDDILIYLDGELQSASTLVGSPQRIDTRTGPAAIGRSVNGKNHYTGLIDDVRLYDVALSAEQVLALFEEHPQTVLAEDNTDEPEPSEQSIEADDEAG